MVYKHVQKQLPKIVWPAAGLMHPQRIIPVQGAAAKLFAFAQPEWGCPSKPEAGPS